ncbi:MAG: hypothetical protein CUN54_03695 [Phototrophicales bacterium]|nr:MAG: hypothetical protein CUN54_03695 [Phototrophicales bacterium]
MAQQKSLRKRAQQKAAEKKPATQEEPVDKVERYSVKPEFWETILDAIPPWSDEIAGIVLIIFGILSFISLLVPSNATISDAWSNAVTGLFGYGGIVVSGGILLAGLVLLLPPIKERLLSFPSRRLLGLEIAFLCFLAILHLMVGDIELRAIARAGQGGGQVGWALGLPFVALFSTTGLTIGTIFYAIIFIINLSIFAGIRRQRVRSLLKNSSRYLQKQAALLSQTAENKHTQRVLAKAAKQYRIERERAEREAARTQAKQRQTSGVIIRIRPNFENLPPSQRPGVKPLTRPASTASSTISKPDGDAKSDQDKRVAEKHPLLTETKSEKNFNAIGTLKDKKKGIQLVERPDGRIKRYFTVSEMKEAKKIVKRHAKLPPLELLHEGSIKLPDEDEINNNVVLIENTLLEFDIDVDVVNVRVGPTVTQYAVQPFKEKEAKKGETVLQRTRIKKISSLTNDLALALSAKRLRMEAPVPGESYVGIEVPNKEPSIVTLRSVYESRVYYNAAQKNKSPLLIPLGRDVAGVPFVIDLAQMPHLLVAGTTGSGKSVALAAMTTALLLNNSPDTLRMVMLDPKMVELSRFNGLPHLVGPVETEQERIIEVLKWCTREMDRRYKLLEEHSARNIEIFNSKRRPRERLPYIVIMIDEVGDLMLTFPEDTERSLTRLAQMARAVGMHLVVATQRPSVDVVTGLIKANFPSRIAFAVASGVDSRVILDSVGAENLIGMGDMLYLSSDAAGPKRIQGCFVSDDEVRAITEYWRKWHQEQIEAGKMEKIRVGPWERGLTRRELLSETDPMLESAIELVIEAGEASATMIQRQLNLGYPRAARIMDLMTELGIVEKQQKSGRSRKVLIKPGEDPFKEMIEQRTKEKKM